MHFLWVGGKSQAIISIQNYIFRHLMFTDAISVTSCSINKKLAMWIPPNNFFLPKSPNTTFCRVTPYRKSPWIRSSHQLYSKRKAHFVPHVTRKLQTAAGSQREAQRKLGQHGKEGPFKGRTQGDAEQGLQQRTFVLRCKWIPEKQTADNDQGEVTESQSICSYFVNSMFLTFFLLHKTLDVDSCEF